MGFRKISGCYFAASVSTMIWFSAFAGDPTDQTSFEEQQDIQEVETVHMPAVSSVLDESANEPMPPADSSVEVPEVPEEPPE